VLRAETYTGDLEGLVSDALRLVEADVRGRSVLLKPNLVEFFHGSVVNTDPRLVVATANAMRRRGARSVVVAEGPGHRRDTDAVVQASGLREALDDAGLEFVDLNAAPVVRTPLESHYTGLTELWVPKVLLDTDVVVSMPKLKTHHWAGMTASMKNFFGAVPGAVYGWPKNILHMHGVDNSILDLNATIRPRLTIVDAITAMEGNGPIMGRERHAGFIAMSQDVVAADATCARAMGLDPAKLPYLREGARYLGNIDLDRIDQRGEPLSRFASTFDVIDLFKPYRLG
jgi:uncharacterized protein (DUF362 family)